MKIVLLTPPIAGKDRYGALAAGGVYLPPLGIAILAEIARKENCQVTIIDAEAEHLDYDKVMNRLKTISPDIVGITAATVSIFNASHLADRIKQLNKNIHIILGGPHVSSVPKETMERFGSFDIGVIGEGEGTFSELIKAIKNKESISQIKGIIIRKDNTIVTTGPREFIHNIDSIPYPAWDLLPDITKKYRPSAFGFRKLPATSFITSRGCPARCSFCNQGPWGKKSYREHSVPYLMDMIEILHKKYHIRELVIYDGTFGVNRERLIEFCEALINSEYKLSWSSNARVTTLTPEILRLMKRAGCWSVAYGIESGNQNVLDFLNKGITLEAVRNAIKWTKEAKIMPKGYIMVGLPTDTKNTIKDTMDFVLNIDLDLLTVNHFTPFPGTLDYDRAHKYGKFNPDWKLLNEHSMVFVPKDLTSDYIEGAIREITRRFYFRPRIIKKYLIMLLRPSKIVLLARGMFALIKFILQKPGKKTDA